MEIARPEWLQQPCQWSQTLTAVKEAAAYQAPYQTRQTVKNRLDAIRNSTSRPNSFPKPVRS